MTEDKEKEEKTMEENNDVRKELMDEMMGNREQKYGIKARTARNDPTCVENDAEFAGKIVDVYRQNVAGGSVTRFTLTCGHPGMKKDDDGRYIRDRITVRYFDEEGEWYASKFRKGDFVIAKAVVQTHINIHTGRRTTEFWGQSMEDARKNILQKDYNRVRLTGRVVSAEKENDRWLSVLIFTQLWKTRYNFRTERNDLEDLYRSTTRVRVYCGFGDPDQIVDFRLTKGTNVSIDGRVYGRVEPRQDGHGVRRIESVIAENIKVVGEIQKPQKDPISKVDHKDGEEPSVNAYSSDSGEIEEE